MIFGAETRSGWRARREFLAFLARGGGTEKLEELVQLVQSGGGFNWGIGEIGEIGVGDGCGGFFEEGAGAEFPGVEGPGGDAEAFEGVDAGGGAVTFVEGAPGGGEGEADEFGAAGAGAPVFGAFEVAGDVAPFPGFAAAGLHAFKLANGADTAHGLGVLAVADEDFGDVVEAADFGHAEPEVQVFGAFKGGVVAAEGAGGGEAEGGDGLGDGGVACELAAVDVFVGGGELEGAERAVFLVDPLDEAADANAFGVGLEVGDL